MAGRKKGRRRSKRELVRQFAQTFDLQRLDYRRRIRPAGGKAKLYGVLAAFMIYSAGFGVGYYGWHNQAVAYEAFAKLVWLLMIPATVIGVFCWLLARNRLEYPIRRDISEYMRALEAADGLLWRYAPLLAELCPDNYACKEVMALSREGRLADIAPEDYCRAVHDLHQALASSTSRAVSAETSEELARNLDSLQSR